MIATLILSLVIECCSLFALPPGGLCVGGPISISQEVATAFNLVSGRETCIRRVDKDLVALDLVEFRFKV